MKPFRGSATTLLSLAAGAVAAAAVVAAWVPLTREAMQREKESLVGHLGVSALLMRGQVEPWLAADADPDTLVGRLDGLRAASEVAQLALLDPEGALLVSAVEDADLPPPPLDLSRRCATALAALPPTALRRVAFVTGATDGVGDLQVACTDVEDENGPMTLVLVETADYTDALSATRLRATLLFLALGLVAGLVVVAATRWLLSPVREVSMAAARIAKGERGVTVAVRGPDEIAQLGRAVNALASNFEAREDDIRARLDVVNQLSSMVAHEVRNPLQSLSLFCALARSEEDPVTRGQMIAKIESEIHVLEGVVQRFLRSSGPLQISLAEVDLVEVLKRAAVVAEPEAHRRNVRLMLQAPGRLRVMADGSLIRRALENLMLNAIEFAGQSPPGQVTAALLPRGREVLLIVEDDGPGVPADERDRIFQAYYSSKSGGTGLGLALVKQVMEAHGGTIASEASPLGGARFVASLPLKLVGESTQS